jgi:hypothetical protein
MTSLLLTLAVALAAPVPKDGKADKELREKVDAARAKAVKFLKEKQDKDGSWEGLALGQIAGMKGGVTALAALGLLEAGVPPNDPTVAKAVEYLAKLEPDKTYVVSLRAQVLARVDAKKYAKAIQADADWFMDKAIRKAGKLQGWSYPANAIADNSNTHFAVMGLHAAAQTGAKVDEKVWRELRDYFAATQQKDGGWTYHNGGTDRLTTRSMTTAALLGLAVAAKYDKQAKGPDPAFEKGMAALLGENKFGDGKSIGYELLTEAELGRTLGTTEFKSGKMTKAWYREGAEKLVKEQQEDGSFKVGEKGIDGGQPVITTACGLYLLGPRAKK